MRGEVNPSWDLNHSASIISMIQIGLVFFPYYKGSASEKVVLYKMARHPAMVWVCLISTSRIVAAA